MNKINMIKKRMYEIVEASKDDDKSSKAYDIMMLIAVVVGLIPLTMKTENKYCIIIDVFTAILFLFDYMARLYTSDYKMGVKSYKAYLAYVFTPLAMVDFLSIVPVLSFILPASQTIKLFRIVRVLLLLKLTRYSNTMRIITNVIRRVKRQLMAVLVLTIIYIMASAMVIFQLEPDLFKSFFDALYWATISITTIGYGDISPITTIGRFITMISALVGVAVIALPSGIITAGYMDEVKRKKSKLEL